MTRMTMFRIATVIAAPLVMAAPANSIAGPITGAAMRAAAPAFTTDVRHRPAARDVWEYSSYSYWESPRIPTGAIPGIRIITGIIRDTTLTPGDASMERQRLACGRCRQSRSRYARFRSRRHRGSRCVSHCGWQMGERPWRMQRGPPAHHFLRLASWMTGAACGGL